jgi:hypothetical protein
LREEERADDEIIEEWVEEVVAEREEIVTN